jgi:hypothetical protein
METFFISDRSNVLPAKTFIYTRMDFMVRPFDSKQHSQNAGLWLEFRDGIVFDRPFQQPWSRLISFAFQTPFSSTCCTIGMQILSRPKS